MGIRGELALYVRQRMCYIARTRVFNGRSHRGSQYRANARSNVGKRMAQNRNGSRNGTPAYKKIQNVIRKRIEGGQLKIGDAVD